MQLRIEYGLYTGAQNRLINLPIYHGLPEYGALTIRQEVTMNEVEQETQQQGHVEEETQQQGHGDNVAPDTSESTTTSWEETEPTTIPVPAQVDPIQFIEVEYI